MFDIGSSGEDFLTSSRVEQSLDNLKRRGTSRPAMSSSRIRGTGYLRIGWFHSLRLNLAEEGFLLYSQRRRDAADAMLEDRVNTHFSALNILVKLTTARRWEHRPHYDMVREGLWPPPRLWLPNDPRSGVVAREANVCGRCYFIGEYRMDMHGEHRAQLTASRPSGFKLLDGSPWLSSFSPSLMQGPEGCG